MNNDTYSLSEGAARTICRVLDRIGDGPATEDECLKKATIFDLLRALAHDDAADAKSEWTQIGLDSRQSLLNIERLSPPANEATFNAQFVLDHACEMAESELPQFEDGKTPCGAEIARRHLLAACVSLLPVFCQEVLGIRGDPKKLIDRLVIPWSAEPPPAAQEGKTPRTGPQLPFTVANPAANPERQRLAQGPQPNQQFLELCYKVMGVFPPDTFDADEILLISNKIWNEACLKNHPPSPPSTSPPAADAPAI